MLRFRSRSHARSLLIALMALALTAGAAVAARPDGSTATGLERAVEVSGKAVPLGAAAAPDVDAPEPDADAPEPAVEHPDNHGAEVSAAAQGETPADAANHGQYVRSVARDNHGQEVAAERQAEREARQAAKGQPVRSEPAVLPAQRTGLGQPPARGCRR